MFITVNYGDKKKALFNPNCKTRLLLENIKDRCQIPREMEIDLSDNTGHLKHLAQSTCLYANEILTTERELLVPIEIRRNTQQLEETDSQSKRLLGVSSLPNEADVTYIPLLNDQDIITAKFQAQLSRRGTPTAAEGKTKKKKSRLRNSEALNSSLDKANFDLLSAQPMPSSTSPKRNGSGKGTRRGSQSINRSKSRGKNK